MWKISVGAKLIALIIYALLPLSEFAVRVQSLVDQRQLEVDAAAATASKFWTPIALESASHDPRMVLCRLNFQRYAERPHELPMFKDLVDASDCTGSNRRSALVQDLIQSIRSDDTSALHNRVLQPSGFIFHESRVGSTLVANLLASSEQSLVICQANPMSQALTRCSDCSFEYKVQLFRDVTTLMGRSPMHQRLFFKFQSFVVTQMEVVLEAFPQVPWVFIFRDPVQTLTSHLSPIKNSDPKRNERPPCLRSKSNPPDEVLKSVAKATAHVATAPDEAWCAAHLNMLCTTALRQYEKYSHFTSSNISSSSTSSGSGGSLKQRRGLLVHYDSLPGYVPHVLLPLFGVSQVPDSWLRSMAAEAAFYSKGRSAATSSQFSGDSKHKELVASHSIQQFADSIMKTSYTRLRRKAAVGLQQLMPALYQHVLRQQQQRWEQKNKWLQQSKNHMQYPTAFNWTALKSLRIEPTEQLLVQF